MKKSTEQLYRQRILHIQMHIQRNLDANLSLEELARKSYFSIYHFHRIFKAVVGESLQEHIRRLRLERAASGLKHTDESITNIAFDAGYQTHEAFTRAFKTVFGCSPSDFRNSISTSQEITGQDRNGKRTRQDSRNLVTGDGPMKVKIKNIESMRVAFVRHVGPYNEVGEAWDCLCTHLGKEGHLGSASQFIGICYDDPEVTPPEKIRYDACITVDDSFIPEGDVAVQTVGGGEYAVTTHLGPYEKLGKTYARLFGEWLLKSGRELRSQPCLEFYLNDPDGTEPEDLITDICLPLRSKS
ncbi:MAG: AraC family transcriptional regulator [Planctomycetota bacterium]|jgi:AraC family transcriptional regulator